MTLLDRSTSDPELRLRELPLLSEEEQWRAVTEWNETAKALPGRDAVQLFESQAARRPNATALVFEGSTVTYGDLNERANRLARHLRSVGTGREVGVGVFLDRNASLVTAMLATWKAGGVYVPLDPNYPRAARIHVEGRRPQRRTDGRIFRDESPPFGGRFVCVDGDWEEIERQSGGNLEHDNTQERDLAYIMYTSDHRQAQGSHGQHRGMIRILMGESDRPGLTERDVVAQNAPASFDISVWQMMAALLVGGQVQIFDEETARDAFPTAVQEVDRLGVTVVETVPTLLERDDPKRQERRQGPAWNLKKLRWMI